MPGTLTRNLPTLQTKSFTGRVLERKDLAEGEEEDYVREAIVAVSGNTDDGGDVIQAGAFDFKRTPKIVWSHDLKTLVAKVLEYREILPGSPEMVEKAPDLAQRGYGGLLFRMEFDPLDPESYSAFRKVVFHEDLGWSIGYEVPPDGFKMLKDGRRALTKIYVWEASPLPFGMNKEARTVAVKSLLQTTIQDLRLPEEKASALLELVALLAEADPEPEETKSSPALEGSMEQTQERLRAAINAWANQVYGERDEGNDWWVSIEGTFESEVVATIRVYAGDQESRTYRFGYVEGEDGTVELGEAEEVEIQATVTAEPASTSTGGDDEAAAAVEALDAKALGEMVEEVKKGRVLSEANATALRQAAEAISKVLAAAEKEAEGEKDGKKVLTREIVPKGEGGTVETPAPETEQNETTEGDRLSETEVLEMMLQADETTVEV